MRYPTIIDVAEEAGVSKSLVSLVLSNPDKVSRQSREAVLKAMEKLGYRPNAAARTMVRQQSNVLGVLVSDLHNPFFADLIDGIDVTANDAGYRIVLTTGSRDPKREELAVTTLLEMRVDALILVSPAFKRNFSIEVSRTVPTAVVGRSTRSTTVDSVTNDDLRGAGMVVDHLVELGHRRIAHIDGGIGAGSKPRRTGYKRSMLRNELEDEIWAVSGGFSEEDGKRGMKLLLNGVSPPTAVFVANDLAAIGALEVLDAEGLRVPDDISVVGYDNTAMAASHRMGLTTVDQPRYEMGSMAVKAVISWLDKSRKKADHFVLPPELVIRKSTGPPPS